MKKYNYILGDIHGCYEELLELEEKINLHSELDNANPFIVSCGDMIDRGPYSKQVLEHFINGQRNKTHIALLGNHELMMLQALEANSSEEYNIELPKTFETYREMYEVSKIYYLETSLDVFIQTMNRVWMEAGGKETLHSFGISIFYLSKHKIPKEVIEFLLRLPIFYEDENFFVTHAIADNKDLDRIKLFNNKITNQNLLEIRKSVNNVIWNKKVPNEKINDKLHISGHSPFKEVKVLERQNALQIDTGCVYGNKLTAYCVETNSFLDVKAKRQYRMKNLKD